jgi:transposase
MAALGLGLAGGQAPHPQDQVRATRCFATTPQGCRQVLAWMCAFGELQRVGIESASSYGAGLLLFLQQAGGEVLEVTLMA